MENKNMTTEETYKYECNNCDWRGNSIDFDQDDDEGIPICPECQSTNIYINNLTAPQRDK